MSLSGGTTEFVAGQIRDARPGDVPFTVDLKTSERVIRRVTDGIYREPWAAIRELISNAYDADATRVVVTTDAPRFQQVAVRDDGNGFTAEALAAMCTSIGGSPKRTPQGRQLGVTADDNPDLSPGGRRLIGKLGIGLFSVSQLTQQFRIVTKVRGSRERIVADVVLFRYAEHRDRKATSPDEVETTGQIQITKLVAHDVEAHGTDVIIESLLPRTRDEFQSRDLWQLIHNATTGESAAAVPAFHIGVASGAGEASFLEEPRVPWRDDDPPLQRFRRLAQAMFHRTAVAPSDRRPSLRTTFDNYFRFVWLTALAVPIDYLDAHPFDLTGAAGIPAFSLGPLKSGRATEIHLGQDERLRDRLHLTAPERGGHTAFSVVMDGLELRRPIPFADLPTTDNAVKTPLLFVGAASPNLARFSDHVTGGPLRFEGYLLWCPRIVPVEHNGVLVRIGDASGSLFDETFMRYQISEQKRKEQVTAEIFVHEGMDAALSIDRESFNHSHPHYQFIASWLHDAFKQFATKHKALGAELRAVRRGASASEAGRELQGIVEDLVARWTDGDEPPVPVIFGQPASDVAPTKAAPIVINEAVLLGAADSGGRGPTSRRTLDYSQRASKLTAVTQVLYAAGVLDRLSPDRRDQLLRDLATVIFL